MSTTYDQLNIEYRKTDRESKSVRIICFFLVLIFAFVPLAEFVNGIDYHYIESYPQIFCGMDYIDYINVLSFKPIQ